MNLFNSFQRQSQATKMVYLAVPSSIVLGSGSYMYFKRREYLADPVLQRAILHLKKDQRVIDFCGDNIKPGFLVTRTQGSGENWVKYELDFKGNSGKLKTTLIGDYLHHKDLTELDEERRVYNEAVAKLKAKQAVKKPEHKSSNQSKKSSSWFGSKDSSATAAKSSAQEESKQSAESTQVDLELKKLKEEYVPIDFNAYTIEDQESKAIA